MPNWCACTLTITGPQQDLDAFVTKAQGVGKKNEEGHDIPAEALDFENLFPTPVDLVGTTSPNKTPNRELIDKHGADNWYDWQLKNWGIKWGACNSMLEDHSDKHAFYIFESPWSPPIKFFEKVSKDFPTISFILEYEESGMEFYGTAEIANGVATDNCRNMTRETHPDNYLEDEG